MEKIINRNQGIKLKNLGVKSFDGETDIIVEELLDWI